MFTLVTSAILLLFSCQRHTNSVGCDCFERIDRSATEALKLGLYPMIMRIELRSLNEKSVIINFFKVDSLGILNNKIKYNREVNREGAQYGDSLGKDVGSGVAQFYYRFPMNWVDSTRKIAINRLYSDTIIVYSSYNSIPFSPDTVLMEYELAHLTKTCENPKRVDSTLYFPK
jgi:hypothetical protein